MTARLLARPWTSAWWMPALRGAVAIAAGIMALVWPSLTLSTLVVLVGVYIIVDAVLTLVHSWAVRGAPGSSALRWWAVLGAVVGLLMLLRPGTTLHVLLLILAGWAVVSGLVVLAVATLLRPFTRSAWSWAAAVGIVSVVLGVVVLAHPGFGVSVLSWILGLGVMAYGVGHIGLALGLRRFTGVLPNEERSTQDPTVIEGTVVDDRTEEPTRPTLDS
ncbi:HdeD family acid-resistance protein [Acidipropionibacterium timonense]|uniref:HdeD family acid-resistance protein n=1 Tax=Acidipropionibacterium timonense TaxID=2161818 RepID=UPI00102F9F47|nr:DUF308 domain-containing protein [Acidipropionibacterium timonense]